jgi:hypothetical protein
MHAAAQEAPQVAIGKTNQNTQDKLLCRHQHHSASNAATPKPKLHLVPFTAAPIRLCTLL